MPETFPRAVREGDSYAMSKRESEKRFAQAATPAVIARLFAFIGPHLPLDRNFAAGNFIKDALSGGPIRIEGDGTPLRSYLYAADLAIWLWTLLVNGEPGRAYNVGSDEPLSILQLARRVETIAALTSGVAIAKTPNPGVPPKRYIPSIERARSELHLAPLISIDEGIRRMLEWAKQH
jgi:dTDP-glucose 4,6-dehydratase